jgi:hypothetical protein
VRLCNRRLSYCVIDHECRNSFYVGYLTTLSVSVSSTEGIALSAMKVQD